MQEKRDEIRLPQEQLPQNLKSVILSIGRLNDHEATTVNASKSGISLVVNDVDLTEVNTEEHVTVRIMPDEVKLKGKVVYLQTLSDSEMKIGVSFVNAKSVNTYHGFLG